MNIEQFLEIEKKSPNYYRSTQFEVIDYHYQMMGRYYPKPMKESTYSVWAGCAWQRIEMRKFLKMIRDDGK